MKAEDYHKSLSPLQEACCLAESGWICLPNPLTGGKAMILLRHIALVSKVWKKAGCDRRVRRWVLVREFSTLPLLLIFPLLWPLRKKIYFIIHHNLQWAVRSRLEWVGLSMLARFGARWVLFESQRFNGVEKLNIPSSHNLVLPHPVAPSLPLEKSPKGGVGFPVIGVAGYYRPEKGIDELIGLLKEKVPEFGILLGVPNPEAVKHLDVEVVNTSSNEAYFAMISRCDALVQNGASESYFYRASGPIADAAACGTAVVAPDFPIIGKQVVGIGDVFHCLEKKERAGSLLCQGYGGQAVCIDLPDAVRRAVDAVRAGHYDFDSYCAARSAAALAEQLDDFSREQNGES